MALKLASRVLDFGLNSLNTEADQLLLCSVEPTSYSHATANSLGFKSVSAGALFGDPADYTDGRKIASIAITSGSINTSGTPTCWAAIDSNNSYLLASGPFTPLSALVAGQKFNLDSFTIDMPGKLAEWWFTDSQVDLDFANNRLWTSGSGLNTDFTTYVSCSRASIGYAKTSSGTLTSFATDTLRRTDLGLLIESARTNTVLRSQEMNNAAWSKIDITVIDNSISAPDGTTTAAKLTEGSANSQHEISQGTLGGVGAITGSIFAKQGTRRYFSVVLYDNSSTLYTVTYDLQTGVVAGTNGAGSATNPVNSIEAFGNGWYRCSIGCTGSANNNMFIAISDSATPSYGGGRPVYAGDGASYIYAWGAQLEIGDAASSYVPTTTNGVTRAADNITTSGDIQTAIAAATGSIVAQVDNGKLINAASNVVDSNGTNLLGFNASNNALASLVGTLATGNTANRTSQDKLGLAWNASGRSLVLNGGTVATDATAQTPSSTQHVGSSGAANFANAYIERLTVWTSKLADATLQSRTAP